MEFEVAGHRYLTEPMDCWAQMKVAARLMPLAHHMAALMHASRDKLDAEGKRAAPSADEMMALMAPVLGAFADMADDPRETICKTCLAVVRRIGPNNTSTPVWNKQAGQIQYVDMSLPHMLQIVVRVVTENLSGFFPGLPGGGRPSTQAPPSTP